MRISNGQAKYRGWLLVNEFICAETSMLCTIKKVFASIYLIVFHMVLVDWMFSCKTIFIVKHSIDWNWNRFYLIASCRETLFLFFFTCYFLQLLVIFVMVTGWMGHAQTWGVLLHEHRPMAPQILCNTLRVSVTRTLRIIDVLCAKCKSHCYVWSRK